LEGTPTDTNFFNNYKQSRLRFYNMLWKYFTKF